MLNKRQLRSSDGELEGIIEEARRELARRERGREREREAGRRGAQGDEPGEAGGAGGAAKPGGYQWQMVRCKSDCRCNGGRGHGPYLYRFFRSAKTGRMTSEYIGVNVESHPDAPPRPEPKDALQLKPLPEEESNNG